ncbi:hypothetical protein Tco_1390489 [Tanacetum coccineum]
MIHCSQEITSLKRRVKKLEQKKKSRPYGLRRLYRVGTTTKVESSGDEASLGEDASKQERKIDAMDADETITLVRHDEENDITLAQTLMEIKSTKPKVKGVVIQDPDESTTTKSS